MVKLMKSYFRKDKFGILVMCLLSILSVFFMIIGISIMTKTDTLYEEKVESLNEPHIMLSYNQCAENQELFDEMLYTMLDKSNTYMIEKSQYLEPKGNVTFFIGNENYNWSMYPTIRQLDNKRMIKEEIELKDGEIGVYMNANNNYGFDLGQSAKLIIGNQTYHLKVQGVYESVNVLYYNTTFFVSKEFYELLLNKEKDDFTVFTEYNYYLIDTSYKLLDKIPINFKESLVSTAKLYSEIDKSFDINNVVVGNNTYEMAKNATLPYINIMAIALISFSMLVIVIAIITIIFTINNSIYTEVKNIGLMNAIGYDSKTIRKSYILLYIIALLIGIVVGIALGTTLLPIFTNIITMMANLTFIIPVNLWSILIGVVLVSLAIVLTLYFATRNINKITPLYALRDNIETHSFKKNRVPLGKVRADIRLGLGVKSVFNNTRQSLVLFTIVSVMCILAVFVSSAFFNLHVDVSPMVNMSPAEDNEANIIYPNYKVTDNVREIIKNDERVDYVLSGYNLLSKNATGAHINLHTVEDFDKLRLNKIVKGRYPKYDNEIVVDSAYMLEHNLDIGDSITIELVKNPIERGEKFDFVIVGISQVLGMNGYMYVTKSLIDDVYLEDIKKGLVENVINELDFVYMKEPYKSKIEFYKFRAMIFEEISKLYPEASYFELISIGYGKDNIESSVLSVVKPASDAVMKIFFIIGSVLIFIFLALIMKIKFMREKVDYAVYKALGYTSFDIMLMISLSMLIISVVASIIGCFVGGLLFKPFINGIGNVLGIINMGFVVNWLYILAVFVGINILIFIVSILLSLNVKRIKPNTVIKTL